jgi:hypothetical protein
LPDSIEESGLPEHGVTHPPQVPALQSAPGALEHGGRRGRPDATGGRAGDHLVRGQHSVAAAAEVVIVEFVPPSRRWLPGRPDGHLHGRGLVGRRRRPDALRLRGGRDGPHRGVRGLGGRRRAPDPGRRRRRGSSRRDGRLAPEQRARAGHGRGGRSPSHAAADQEPPVPLMQRQRGEEAEVALPHPTALPLGRRRVRRREEEVVLMELVPGDEGLRRGRGGRRRREHPDEPHARRRPARAVVVHGRPRGPERDPGGAQLAARMQMQAESGRDPGRGARLWLAAVRKGGDASWGLVFMGAARPTGVWGEVRRGMLRLNSSVCAVVWNSVRLLLLRTVRFKIRHFSNKKKFKIRQVGRGYWITGRAVDFGTVEFRRNALLHMSILCSFCICEIGFTC